MPSTPKPPFTPPKRRSSGGNPLGTAPTPPTKGAPVLGGKRPQKSSRGLQKRSENRLSRIIARGGKAPAGVKPGRSVTVDQAKAIKAALLALNANKRAETGTAKPSQFDPLAPLTGKNFDEELGAASREQFGEQDRTIKNAYEANTQGQELTGSYFDQYKKALDESTARLKAANDESVTASQGRVDTAFTDDTAAAKARDAAASAKVGALGLSGTQGDEGVRAAEAARSQGNQSVAGQRTQAQSSNTMMEGRSTNALLAKAENLARQNAKRQAIGEDERSLAKSKGDFATNFRTKARESERSWAAVQKEFGLKEEDMRLKNKSSAADRKIEAGKQATQKLVAKMYSDADKVRAKATIRVAKLQLEKGKIDQHQYNEIVNIYKGLPAKGKPTPAKTKPADTGEGGSGPGGSLAPWEQDAKTRAYDNYKSHKYGRGDRLKAINAAIKAGIPRRLAEKGWDQYIGKVKTPYDNRTRG